MKFFVDALQSVLIDMGVDLGCGDIGMAEHHLHRAQVGAMAEEVGGKRMADHVRRDFLRYTDSKGGFPDYLPKSQAGHAGAAPGDEKIVAALVFKDERPGRFQVIVNFFPSLVAKGNQSFFIAFAEHPDKPGVQVACGKWQTDQFRDPQTGRVENKKHGIIPFADGRRTVRGSEQAHNLGL